MEWSNYHYLVVVMLAALVVLAMAVRLAPALLEEQNQPHRTPSELAILLLVTVLGLSAVYTNFYLQRQGFGWWDVGSDTLEQYVPYYLNLVESLRAGTLGFWNYDYGLGASFMSYQSWTLDPFNLIVVPICLIMGTSKLSLALVVAQSCKILLAALLFDHLLLYYCRTPLARILGAVLYAFSGYLMLWGQHYWLGSVCVIAVALLVALEALLVRWTVPRFWGVLLLSALSIISSTYIGFMVMLFAATYALIRSAHASEGGLGGWLRRFGRLAVPATCGVVTSCVTLVPYALLMLGQSSRIVGGGQSPFSERIVHYLQLFVPTRWILPILSRMLGNTLISSAAAIPETSIPPTELLANINVFEFVSLGLSCGVLILFLQFVSCVAYDMSRRDKLLVTLAFLLVLAYLVNAFLPALTNVFAETKYRSSFAVCIVGCLMMAYAFEHRAIVQAPSRPLLLVGALATISVIVWSVLHTVDGLLICLFYLGCLVLATLLLWQRTSMDNDRLLVVVCALLVATSVADGFFATHRRTVSSMEDFPLACEPNKASDTAEAIAYLHDSDPEFYRIEKLDYFDWSSYNNDSLVQGYAGISAYNSTIDSCVEAFFQNLWPRAVRSDVAYQSFRKDTQQPALLNMLGVRYLLSYDAQDLPWLKELAQFGHIHVYQNVYHSTKAPSLLSLYSHSVGEQEADNLESARKRVKQILVGQQALIVDDDHVKDLGEVAPDWDGTVQLEGRVLTAKVTSNADAIACLAIPHTTGWELTIDGTPTTTFAANYGLMGFELPAGEHLIEARFRPKGMAVGCLLCAAGLLAGIAGCVICSRRADRA